MPRHQQIRAAAVTAALLAAPAARAHHYAVTTVDIPGQDITQTTGNPGAFNSRDELVGSTFKRPSTYQGFIVQSGTVTLTPSCDILAAINDHGLAVGYTQSGFGYCTVSTATGNGRSYTVHAAGNGLRLVGINLASIAAAQIIRRNDVTVGLLLARNRTTTLQVPGSMNRYGGTYPTGINDAATVVGYYSDAAAIVHGFTYAAGSYTSFDVPFPPQSVGTYPYFITQSGDLGGGYLPGPHTSTTVGFVRINGQFQDISPPGSVGSYVEGIGPGGEIIGSYIDANHVTHGFIDHAGTYQTLDIAGSVRTQLTSVNQRGTLAGDWQDADGVQHAFTAR